MRTFSYELEPQCLSTKDSVNVNVIPVVHFKVVDPVASIKNVKNYEKATRLLALSSLSNAYGKRTFQEVLDDPMAVSNNLNLNL